MDTSEIFYIHRALVLFDQGYSVKQVAKVIGKSEEIIDHWVQTREKATAYQDK